MSRYDKKKIKSLKKEHEIIILKVTSILVPALMTIIIMFLMINFF